VALVAQTAAFVYIYARIPQIAEMTLSFYATPVLMHLMQILEPRGVLEWDELDIASLFMYPPGSSPDACNSFEKRLVSMYPGANAHHSNNWISQLSSIFVECGLADVQAIKMGKPREGMWRFGADNLLEAYREIARRIGGGLEEEIEKLDMERLKGVCFTYECAVALGRKALES
jgi:hypothetical protein